jgi:hypothetical protein
MALHSHLVDRGEVSAVLHEARGDLHWDLLVSRCNVQRSVPLCVCVGIRQVCGMGRASSCRSAGWTPREGKGRRCECGYVSHCAGGAGCWSSGAYVDELCVDVGAEPDQLIDLGDDWASDGVGRARREPFLHRLVHERESLLHGASDGVGRARREPTWYCGLVLLLLLVVVVMERVLALSSRVVRRDS